MEDRHKLTGKTVTVNGAVDEALFSFADEENQDKKSKTGGEKIREEFLVVLRRVTVKRIAEFHLKFSVTKVIKKRLTEVLLPQNLLRLKKDSSL